ncbi:MAG: recombinase family protein [Acidimicrobiia bacterium]
MGKPTRAALYSRVSTDEQAERGTSLGDQQRRLERYCTTERWSIVDLFVDDGVSGATIERPGLQRLLTGARAGDFDVVVVTDPDRLSRDLVDGLVIERELAGLNVEVVYLIQPTMGTLERQIRGVIAEEERRKIRERTSRGLRSVAASGHWPGGPPPYGYQIRRSENGHSALEVNDGEAATLVRMIDALVDRRLSTWELAAELNEASIPIPSAGRKLSNAGGPRWTHRRVRDTLRTARAIAGTWTYTTSAGTFEIDVPAIVTKQRLQQLRERLAETSTGVNATAKKHQFLLARRVTSTCGHAMHAYARPDGTGRVYRCSQSTADRGPERCDCQRVSADAVETATWNLIATELTDPHRLEHLAGLAATLPTEQPETEDVDALGRKIKRLEHALGNDIADLLADGADPATIRTATQQLDRRLATLRRQRSQALHWAAARADHASQIDRLHKLAESAHAAIAHATPDLQSRIIDLLDIRITIVGHRTCTTCEGRGLLPNTGDHPQQRRRKTGTICPACNRYRSIPDIEIQGLLPTTDHLPATPDTEGLPFTLRSIA